MITSLMGGYMIKVKAIQPNERYSVSAAQLGLNATLLQASKLVILQQIVDDLLILNERLDFIESVNGGNDPEVDSRIRVIRDEFDETESRFDRLWVS
jgi:hypothetical protein